MIGAHSLVALAAQERCTPTSNPPKPPRHLSTPMAPPTGRPLEISNRMLRLYYRKHKEYEANPQLPLLREVLHRRFIQTVRTEAIAHRKGQITRPSTSPGNGRCEMAAGPCGRTQAPPSRLSAQGPLGVSIKQPPHRAASKNCVSSRPTKVMLSVRAILMEDSGDGSDKACCGLDPSTITVSS